MNDEPAKLNRENLEQATATTIKLNREMQYTYPELAISVTPDRFDDYLAKGWIEPDGKMTNAGWCEIMGLFCKD